VSTDAVVAALGALASRSRIADHSLSGHFANVVTIGGTRVAIGTDGVGTKILLGMTPSDFAGLAVDCAAMNANDLICVGARPVALVDYLAIDCTADAEAYAKAIAEGFVQAEQQGAGSIVGGEVAVLPGIVAERADGVPGMDLSATAIGLVEGEVLSGAAACPGDLVLGVASSGVHSNGFTLLRELVAREKCDLDAPAPFGGRTLRQELLTPTRLYPALTAAARPFLRSAANITGGGIKNLSRVLPVVGARIDAWPELSPLFSWIAERVPPADCFATFNMGVGFMLVVAPSDVDEAREAIGPAYHVSVIGQLTEDIAPGQVEFRAKGFRFHADRKNLVVA